MTEEFTYGGYTLPSIGLGPENLSQVMKGFEAAQKNVVWMMELYSKMVRFASDRMSDWQRILTSSSWIPSIPGIAPGFDRNR